MNDNSANDYLIETLTKSLEELQGKVGVGQATLNDLKAEVERVEKIQNKTQDRINAINKLIAKIKRGDKNLVPKKTTKSEAQTNEKQKTRKKSKKVTKFDKVQSVLLSKKPLSSRQVTRKLNKKYKRTDFSIDEVSSILSQLEKTDRAISVIKENEKNRKVKHYLMK